MATQRGAALGLNFVRIVQQMKTSREFVSDTHVKIHCPGGFPYQAFNGKAHISPWNILRMVELSRNASFNKVTPNDRCFLNFDKIYLDYLAFIASTKTEITPRFYDYSVSKGPVEMHVELDNVGTSSFSLKTSIYLEGSDSPACKNVTQSVFVDLVKRKPSQPPDWWSEKYSAGLENKQPLKLPRHSVPENGVLSSYQLQISASDLDNYWHTNWSNYVKFSFDAYIDFAVKKQGSADIARAFRNCKQFSVLYMREANLMDTLDVHLWQDCDNVNLFNFQFLKKSNVICESQLELYPEDE